MKEENMMDEVLERDREVDELLERDHLIELQLPVVEQPRTALGYLQGIYRDPSQPEARRMRAATIAIAYESPRLAVTAYLSNADDFSERLDRAIAQSHRPRVIEHQPDEGSDE
jgi:hypothetical protein